MEDRCFICDGRVGRGNQPSIGVHERMSKIISVSQTVEHSSTIISDILSRILNETVMREETICRICFNLLNDIDYHLKEAQEKTDELTGKFLDKGKDPLSYRPQPIVTAASATVSSHSSQVEEAATTSDRQRHAKGRRSKTASISSATSQSKNRQIKVNSNFSSSGSSRKRKQTESESAASHHQDYDTDGAPLTEDEMSVNVINRNKQKLLSHVLNPRMIKKETRVYEYEEEEEEEEEETEKEEEEEEEEEEDEEEEAEEEEEYYEPKWKKKKGKENRRERRKRKKLQQQQENEETELSVSSRYAKSSGGAGSASSATGAAASSSGEFVTVNMDDLGDLLSKPKPVYFAKKSEPVAGKRDKAAAAAAAAAGSDADDESGMLHCGQCKKQFKKKCNLQLHVEKVHQVGVNAVYTVDEKSLPETHKCQLCPREFTNWSSLSAHKDEHKLSVLEKKPVMANAKVSKPTGPAEGEEVKATCPQCHKTFRRLFNMRIHVDRVHKKIKPYPCGKCDKEFATNSDLRQHMTVHGEGKVFECEECGRTFTNRDSIILHRKQHANERTHFCNICDKGFYKASCLSRHRRTHTGERPYTCDLCNKAFSQCTTLKTHRTKCGGGGAGGGGGGATATTATRGGEQQQNTILGV